MTVTGESRSQGETMQQLRSMGRTVKTGQGKAKLCARQRFSASLGEGCDVPAGALN